MQGDDAMKKVLSFLVLTLVFLSGCSDEYIQFHGEGENWEGKYKAVINGSSENGEYTFGYKRADKDMIFKNLRIVAESYAGKTDLNEDEHNGATVKMSTACSGCSITDLDKPIQVTIRWDDGQEETFSMTSIK